MGAEGRRQKPRVKPTALHFVLHVANGPYRGSENHSIHFLSMFHALFSLHLLVCWVSTTLAAMCHYACMVTGELKASIIH